MALKFEKPKILLIDMNDNCRDVLLEAGYNVTIGTFGAPYKVDASENFYPVSLGDCSLPGFQEQEILIVNMECPEAHDAPQIAMPGHGISAIWQGAHGGEIESRLVAMDQVCSAFDRILSHGGIAIVLLDYRYELTYAEAKAAYNGIRNQRNFTLSNCSFLTLLNSLKISTLRGSEIEFCTEGADFAALLKRGSKGAAYHTTVTTQYRDEKWIPVARNKFGNTIAGVYLNEDPEVCFIALPQMPELHTILPELLANWCASWRPKLFPFHEAGSWLYSEEYEQPAINAIRNEIERVQNEAKSQVRQLELQIEDLRTENKDWYTLLSGTGDELVAVVIRSLETLGFEHVVDVDEQERLAGNDRNLGEDIQIHDDSPILIVDVKGITGTPEDSEATQAEKHALIRGRQFKGNVQALTIINHERNLPPHDRNPNLYRQDIVDNAQQTGSGLMTTWDLFRLLRHKEELGWSADVVKPIFYRTGLIEPIPSHYTEIGTIVHVWQDKFGIVPSHAIRVKNRLAIKRGDFFEEVLASSLHVEDNTVNEAAEGSNCGIQCEGAGSRFRNGMRIFLVKG